MKTLLLELDDSIYTQVINFLKALPEKKYHILEASQRLSAVNKPLDVTSAFGLIKTPITATLADFEQGIIAGATDDCA
jgi:hypothetical protein